VHALDCAVGWTGVPNGCDLQVFFPNLTRFSWHVGLYEQTTEVSLLAAGSGWRRSSTRAST
jgi:hypothetical protein